MREIKFSILLQHEETGTIIEKIFDYASVFIGHAQQEISKLGHYFVITRREYIGLKDKNGKDIYEGDVLKGWSDLDVVEVRYVSAGFWFINSGKALQADIEPTINAIKEHEYKIIGNIYENPELLEKGA